MTNIINTRLTHGVIAGLGNYGLDLTVTGQGQIIAPEYGIYANSDASILNQGQIHAGTIGVQIESYGTVNNTGLIDGASTGIALFFSGSLTNSGTIAAGNGIAIYLGAQDSEFQGGTGSNTGLVTGQHVGLEMGSPSTWFDNAGRIYGGLAGIGLVQGTLLNTGTILSDGFGFVGYGGILDNQGSIIAKEVGLFAAAGNLTNQSGGLISGGTIGVSLYAQSFSGPVLTNSGTITGAKGGVYLSASSLINLGDISQAALGVYLKSGTVTNSGAISGATFGIEAYGGTIIASGDITGGSLAIYALHSIALYLNPAANLSGGVQAISGDADLTLGAGQPAWLSGLGSSFQGFSTLNFAPGAAWTLEGTTAGLTQGQAINGFTLGDTLELDGFAAATETLTRDGLILGDGATQQTLAITSAPFVQNFAIAAANGATSIAFTPLTSIISTISTAVYVPLQLGQQSVATDLTIAAPGYVTDLTARIPGAITNFGTIAGANPITADDGASIDNAGAILGNAAAGYAIQDFNGAIYNSGSIAAPGIAVTTQFANVTNTGSISGEVDVEYNTLNNTGQISTNGSLAVNDEYATAVYNSGQILGTQTAVILHDDGILANSGTIAAGIGIFATGAELIDSGLIQGSTYAILSDPHDPNSGFVYTLHLTLEAGAEISGAVLDTSGRGTLNLAGALPGFIDLGDSFSGFSDISFAAGADWTLQAEPAAIATAERIHGFAPGDTILLAGFAATSYSVVRGTGLILSNGAASETLAFPGAISTQNFAVTSYGGGTQIQSLASIQGQIAVIASTFTQPIVVGSAYYASALTITQGGAILAASGAAISGIGSVANAGILQGGVNLAGNLNNTGTICGTYGVFAGLLVNSGLITGERTDASTLINTGTIAGGVLLGSATVFNAGLITSPNTGIAIDPGYQGHIINTGTISGANFAISSYNGFYITNAGTIAGNINANGLQLTVDPGAVFTGTVFAGPAFEADVLTLAGTTAGSLDIAKFSGFTNIAFSPGAIWTLEGNQSQITGGQPISGFTQGNTIILDGFAATLENFVLGTGLVLSNATQSETLTIKGGFATSDFAVTSQAGNTRIVALSNQNGTITNLDTTLNSQFVLGFAYTTNFISIANTGAIITSEGQPGIQVANFLVSDATIVNAGFVTGIYDRLDSTIVNSGTIDGAPGIYSFVGDVTNSGLITGATGIHLVGGTIVNSGLITGAQTGIFIENGSVSNSGTISAAGIGIDFYGLATLTNAGAISGGAYAIYDKRGGLLLNIEPGAVFAGAVSSQDSVLNLAAGAGTLNIGNSFSGFSTLNFAPGASWTLEGDASGLSIGQSISGFALGDTIILGNFAETAYRFVPGTGLVLTNGPAGQILDFTSLPWNSNIEVSSNGTSTTVGLAPFVSTILTPLTGEVTPGAGDYATAISITSAGTLNPPAGIAFYARISGAALTNAGTIVGLVEFETAANITNTGTIAGAFGLALHDGGNVLDSGGISGLFAAIDNSAGILNLTLNPGAAFTGAVIDTPGNGTLTLAGGTPGSIDLGTSFTGFSSINFADAWTLEGAAENLAGGQTISGFAPGETVILDNFAATSQTLGPAGLTLSNSTGTETLDITGISQFTVTENAAGGTDITTSVACFVRGTRIATPRGNIAVEKLSVGDLVRTMHGDQPIRWTGRRAYAARFIVNNPDALPIRIRRHAIAFNIPSRDLYVSPDHAIAEGGVLIHAHLLQNGISIHQPNTTEDVEYFHLEFDTHTILSAENISTESFIDEGAGNRFQNSHTRLASAPGQKPCLPRVFEGFHIHNIKSRIAERAGIHAPTLLGPLCGVIDECTPTLIRGWAQNSAAPEHPVTLEIISGAFQRTILANIFRPDLRTHGLGSGCHGFSLPLPNLAGPITVRRASDHAPLPGVGRISEASSGIFSRHKNKRSLF